jgi:hypothetical protein
VQAIEFPPLDTNKYSMQYLPPDVQSNFIYLETNGFQDVKFGGSRTVLLLINKFLGYPIPNKGDYDFISTSDKKTLITAGFIESLHISGLFHAPDKTKRLSVYVPNKHHCPDMSITTLSISGVGTIDDSTGQGLDDLLNLRIRCYGNAQKVIDHDPIKALRIIKYKHLLFEYGFTIEPITDKALHNCKPNPKTNKDHVREVVKKEIGVYGKEYVKDLIHYGLLKKLFGINVDMDLDKTMDILTIELNKKEVALHKQSSIFPKFKMKVENENKVIKRHII